jgi:hypothetical protein
MSLPTKMLLPPLHFLSWYESIVPHLILPEHAHAVFDASQLHQLISAVNFAPESS